MILTIQCDLLIFSWWRVRFFDLDSAQLQKMKKLKAARTVYCFRKVDKLETIFGPFYDFKNPMRPVNL